MAQGPCIPYDPLRCDHEGLLAVGSHCQTALTVTHTHTQTDRHTHQHTYTHRHRMWTQKAPVRKARQLHRGGKGDTGAMASVGKLQLMLGSKPTITDTPVPPNKAKSKGNL